MASGQGGEDQQGGREPERQQPPYGQAASGQPEYGRPAEGQPSPGQGYAPAPPPSGGYGGYAPAPPPSGGYGGYGPAPAAPGPWGGQAPPHMERPVSVRAGLGLFIAEILLGLVGSVYVFANIRDLVNRMLADARLDTHVDESTLRAGIIVGAVIGLVLVAAELLFIWFAWQGRNWARIVLFVIGGLGIVSGLVGLSTNSQFGGFYATLSIFQWLITIAAVVLLALKPSNEWYRYKGLLRLSGAGR